MKRVHAVAINARTGFSLLEVLVAAGILVVGLSSVAAILPAATARLSEAASQDRATNLTQAALTEIKARNLCSKDLFAPNTPANAGILFGETLPLALTQSATSRGYVTSGTITVPSTTILSGTLLSGTNPRLLSPNASAINPRISNATTDRRQYYLEDEVTYVQTTDLPANSFLDGVRRFNRGTCWGALVTPFPNSTLPSAATAANVSIAVFRKPGEAVAMTLTLTPPSSAIWQSTMTPGSVQRTLLKPGAKVLAVPAPTGTSAARWLTVRSSWLSGSDPFSTVATGTTNVIFERNPTGDFITLLGSGTQAMNVVAYDTLLLVSEHILPLR